MPISVVGLSHRTAPIELRERLYVDGDAVPDRLARIERTRAVRECIVLSTCNRTEYYLHATDPAVAEQGVVDVMLDGAAGRVARNAESPERRELPAGAVYRRRGEEAVRHLFRVAGGLDSLVPGEHQIQGQVRAAYEEARRARPETVGPVLHRLFQSALRAGGRVRSETGIGEGAASVPSAAVHLAAKVLGSLHKRSAMVIGAGDMGRLTLRCLADAGARGVVVASRRQERAERAAMDAGADVIPLAEFWGVLERVDVIVTSTAAPHPLVTAERLRAARDGNTRALLILDIALPRNVEPAVGEIPGVFLYNIDDLQRVVDATGAARAAERDAAEMLVSEEVDDFGCWYRSRAVGPLIRDLRAGAERIRRQEIEEALRELPALDDDDRERIRRASRRLLGRMLHGPITALREAAGEPGGAELLRAARRGLERAAEAAGEASAERAARADGKATRSGGEVTR